MPSGGAWTSAKRSATAFAQSPTGSSPGSAIASYLSAIGGSGRVSSASGGGIGAAARSTASNLGGFFEAVAAGGLQGALEASKLSALVGRSASEVLSGLVDALVGDGSTLDEGAARRATMELWDEVVVDATTFEEIDKALSEAITESGIEGLLANFFGFYLSEIFARDFYEHWTAKIGSEQAEKKLAEVRAYVSSAVKARVAQAKASSRQRRLSRPELKKVVDVVMRDTFQIFEAP